MGRASPTSVLNAMWSTSSKAGLSPPATGLRRRRQRQHVILSTNGTDEILYKWLHLCNRLPAPRPRRVHKSSEFRVSSECLATALKEGLALIERKLVTGETIHRHLSRKIGELDFHDLLLDDWDIQHLHLGTAIAGKGKSKGLIEGTREGVYCMMTCTSFR
jgi:hypothetical protein